MCSGITNRCVGVEEPNKSQLWRTEEFPMKLTEISVEAQLTKREIYLKNVQWTPIAAQSTGHEPQ